MYYYMAHLHLQCPLLDLLDALLDDERNAIRTALEHAGEVTAKQLETALQLLVTTLDGQGLQALLMAGQEALQTTTLACQTTASSTLKFIIYHYWSLLFTAVSQTQRRIVAKSDLWDTCVQSSYNSVTGIKCTNKSLDCF